MCCATATQREVNPPLRTNNQELDGRSPLIRKEVLCCQCTSVASFPHLALWNVKVPACMCFVQALHYAHPQFKRGKNICTERTEEKTTPPPHTHNNCFNKLANIPTLVMKHSEDTSKHLINTVGHDHPLRGRGGGASFKKGKFQKKKRR